jgi:NDP-sugar pyrophosphorylase family protein
MAQGISNNLTAFILAAGTGSRLGKITHDKPKALVEFGNKPMIDMLMEKLIHQGFTNFVVNLFHHADLLKSHLLQKYNGLALSFSDETTELLDTGGAIKHAQDLLSNKGSFLVHNVDVVIPFNPLEMLDIHNSTQGIMTLAVSDRKSTRKLLFDEDNHLCGWTNLETGQVRRGKNYTPNHKMLSFSGVQWVSSEYFEHETHSGRFSIIDSWLTMSHIKPIIAFEHSEEGWFDLGTESKIREAETKLGLIHE